MAETCQKCGEDHLGRCIAHVKHGERQGKRCRRGPTPGATVCYKHGASAPQVKQSAARRVTVAKVTKAIQGEIIGPISDPQATLELLAGESLRYFEKFRDRVEELQSARYESAQGFEQIRGEAQLMAQWMDKAQKSAEILAKLPLEERRVRVTEFQMRRVFLAISAGLAKSGLTEQQQAAIKAAIAEELLRTDKD